MRFKLQTENKLNNNNETNNQPILIPCHFGLVGPLMAFLFAYLLVLCFYFSFPVNDRFAIVLRCHFTAANKYYYFGPLLKNTFPSHLRFLFVNFQISKKNQKKNADG